MILENIFVVYIELINEDECITKNWKNVKCKSKSRKRVQSGVETN